MRPRRGRLADGRTILYFDDATSPGRGDPPPDRRALDPPPPPGELRYDALLDEWIILAAHRQARTFLPPASECPLCPSRGTTLTEVPAHDYDVVVFENRFPSLPAAIVPDGPPVGRAEVICYSSDHEASFPTLSDERLDTIAAAWLERSAALSDDPGTAAVFVFENRGEEIGVTLHHPHGQVYAYPFVPPRLERMLGAADRHRDAARGACLGCDLLADELRDGRRILVAGSTAVAYVPSAARWPYEVHVVPRRHVGQLAELEPAELAELVRLHADALARLDQLFGREVPAMSGWFASPARAEGTPLHLRLEVVSPQRDAGKLKYLASSESLMGAFIGDVAPEDAAERLRSVPGRGGR
jgi:UDPglucose--hexose-1-phosphate uridylyltransferase